jgi:hypothetical protein
MQILPPLLLGKKQGTSSSSNEDKGLSLKNMLKEKPLEKV